VDYNPKDSWWIVRISGTPPTIEMDIDTKKWVDEIHKLSKSLADLSALSDKISSSHDAIVSAERFH
jgi:hypothetical protein